jgi:hypothetical protein
LGQAHSSLQSGVVIAEDVAMRRSTDSSCFRTTLLTDTI